MAKLTFGTRAAESKGPKYAASTRTLQVAEDIIPIAALKAQLSQIVRGLDARPRPLVVTLNGKAAAVVMSPREYDRLTYEARFLRAVQAGAGDAAAGRTIDDRELARRIERRYGRRDRAR